MRGISWLGRITGGLIALAAAGCATPAGTGRVRAEIEGVLGRQAACWNAGDTEGFMEPYWHSPELTFSSGGRVTRGWQSTLDGYRRRYPTRETMGRLTFDQIEVIDLGPNVALVLGRWRLEREEPVGGAFSLVMRRQRGRWVIVHDHTSRDTSGAG